MAVQIGTSAPADHHHGGHNMNGATLETATLVRADSPTGRNGRRAGTRTPGWPGRWAAVAGIAAPIAFLSIVALLAVIQYDFLVRNGADPTTSVFPSANVAGPYGWLMTANFLGTGVLILIFAVGFRRAIAVGGRAVTVGVGFLLATGLGVVGAGLFATDVPVAQSPSVAEMSVHGLLHAVCFFVAAVSLPVAAAVLAWPLSRHPSWRVHGRYSLLTAIAVVSCFVAGAVLRGHAAAVANYLFFIVGFGWFAVMGMQLRVDLAPRHQSAAVR